MTTEAAEVRLDAANGDCFVTGALDFANVPSLPLAVPGDGEVAVDLSGVGRVDSAGVALLLEWVREARAHGRALVFRGMPAQLLAIARVSGVDTILPLDDR